jgi:predicted site-specific integrase-resolvase
MSKRVDPYPDELFTPTTVADLLGVRPETLSQWRWRGKGPTYVKVGGLVRYRHADLTAWLATRTHTWDGGPR